MMVPSQVYAVFLIHLRLRSKLVKWACTTEQPAAMQWYPPMIEEVEDEEAPVPPSCK